MKIKLLNRKKLYNSLPVVWKVFCDYEAVNYPEIGEKVFWDAIHIGCVVLMFGKE